MRFKQPVQNQVHRTDVHTCYMRVEHGQGAAVGFLRSMPHSAYLLPATAVSSGGHGFTSPQITTE